MRGRVSGGIMIDLNGKWTLKDVAEGMEYAATVPSCNYLDLMANGAIEDPFKGTNEKDCLWVAQRDWSWFRHFDVSAEDLRADRLVLVCEQLDTLATVLVNREAVAYADNCHVKHEFDIKKFLKQGRNQIEIIISSPVNYITEQRKLYRTPANPNGIDGIDRIRKPQCHFGWDWGPVLPPSGITGNIYIEARNTARIAEFSVVQTHSDGEVSLRVDVLTELIEERATPEITVELVSPEGKVTGITREYSQKSTFCFTVTEPELWWPNGMSERREQPLYECRVTLRDKGETVCTESKKIGLRTIELDRNPDSYGDNFRFLVNGKRVFCKGANLIPFDSFDTRTDKEKLEYYVRAAAECNFNMIRVWGGGYYASEALLDLCDRYGIMIWQDFMFACMTYPFYEPNFLANVQKEVFFNVKRMRERACLAVWCGNNEIEAMSNLWVAFPKSMHWNEEFFYKILPEWVAVLDRSTPYIPTSPCGTSQCKNVQSDNIGDTHLWAVWHGLQPLEYYRRRPTRFCSEFGFESLPDEKTLRFYAEKKDYSLDSEVFNAHQKCASGNKKMVYYIASRFDLPKEFRDYVYLSQICQSECIRDATEFWRRNSERCNGSLFWQFNDCWPVCSWASIDYFGNYKCLQYRAKHFFAPVSVQTVADKKGLKVHFVNDSAQKAVGNVKVEVVSFDGERVYAGAFPVCAESGFNKEICSVSAQETGGSKRLRNCFAVAVFSDAQGNEISRSSTLFYKENKVALPAASVRAKVVGVRDGRAEVEVTTDKFARFVRLSTDVTTAPFDDNFFDMLPGEKKRVSISLDGTDAEKFSSSLSVRHLAEVKKGESRFVQNLRRLSIFLIPINFFSYIYYRWLI